MREPVRDQIELRAVDIDSLVGQDHKVRLFWAYVIALDLRELEGSDQGARAHARSSSGLAAAAARTVALRDQPRRGQCAGLGAAVREPRCVCWLCGGVSVNHHQLSDFRVGCADLLDRLLASMWRRWRRLG